MNGLLNVKWSHYIPHKPTAKQLAFIALPHEEALYGGAAGGGKALSLSHTNIYTPYGSRSLRDIKVGHKVCTPDGSTASVIGVYDQGKRPTYKIKFQDGTHSICDEEHLWQYSVARKGKWRKSGKEWKVATTLQMIQMMESGRTLLTPVTKPVQFTKNYRFNMRTLNPWLIGALIGGGCLTNPKQVQFCSDDLELLDKAKKLYSWKEYKRSKTFSTLTTRDKLLIQELIRLGLSGKYSYEKEIPDCYLYGTIEDRWELLQGLMDTDGYISEEGKAYYTTTSKKLSKNVKWLVASLGGRATITSKNPTAGDMLGRKAYTVYMTFPDNSKCVSLTRKKERASRCCSGNLKRRIVSIEYFGEEECRCIKIDNPNGLFLIDDFIVTHNSDALLMIALQYFDCPGYKGILFRRSLTDHKLPSSILNRAKSWLAPFLESGEVRWNPGEHTFYSKEGGMLTFGYLDKEGSKERYQSAEFHTVCFDEASQFKMDEILYLFSRMRRTAETRHIPLRFRLGTNPGGRNHAGIKKRFGIEKDPDGEFRGHDPTRPFIQAKVADNKHLDAIQYERQLDKLDPVTRDRLKKGDWSASDEALYKDSWFKNRWSKKGDYYTLLNDRERKTFHQDQVFIFGTTDVAGSEKTGVEKKAFRPNQEPSWSVYSIWGMTPDFQLLHLDQYRYQCSIPNFIHRTVEATRLWKPAIIMGEDNAINLGFIQGCQDRGLPIQGHSSIADKITRATSAVLLAERGNIWLPTYAEWLADWEDELFVWTGKKDEIDDQIDTLSLAGSYVSHKRHGTDIESGVADGRWSAAPASSAGLFPTGALLGNSGLWENSRRTA